jgi:cysteine desulfurase
VLVQKGIYLDNAATTKVIPEIKEFFFESMEEDFANASAAHKLGKTIFKKIEKARQSILKGVNAKKSQTLIFTSSATESNNMIIRGISLKSHEAILFSEADHPSLVEPVLAQENQKIVLKLKRGVIDINDSLDALTADIKLVILSHVNNQSGIHQDVESIVKAIRVKCKEVHIHLDAVQSFTKIPLDVERLDVDSVAISAHKIGAPIGIAALVLPKKVNINPLLYGGGQENNLRSSTLCSSLILSFAKASELLLLDTVSSYEKVENFNNDIQKAFELHPNVAFIFDQTSAYIMTFLIKGVASDIILRYLETYNIYASSSSACSAKIKAKSELFLALGIEETYHKNVLRISFSRSTTKAEIEQFIATLHTILDELKGLMK